MVDLYKHQQEHPEKKSIINIKLEYQKILPVIS